MKGGVKFKEGKFVPCKRGHAALALRIIDECGPMSTEDIIMEMKDRGYRMIPSTPQLAQLLTRLNTPRKQIEMQTLDLRLNKKKETCALWGIGAVLK